MRVWGSAPWALYNARQARGPKPQAPDMKPSPDPDRTTHRRLMWNTVI